MAHVATQNLAAVLLESAKVEIDHAARHAGNPSIAMRVERLQIVPVQRGKVLQQNNGYARTPPALQLASRLPKALCNPARHRPPNIQPPACPIAASAGK